MNILIKNTNIFLFTAIFLSHPYPAESIEKKAQKRYNKIRVLVMDFETKEKKLTEEAKNISFAFRKFFAKHGKFATIDINIINQLMISRKQKVSNRKEKINDLILALYIGKRLRTHKIIIGHYNKKDDVIELVAEMVDVIAGNTELKMKLEVKENQLNTKLPPFIKAFADKISGIVQKQRKKASVKKDRKKQYSCHPKVSVFGGVITPLGDIKDYLLPSFIIMFKISIDAPYIPWTTLDFNSGYSRINGKNITNGYTKENFIPIYLSLTFSYPIFKNPLFPRPVLIAGAGVTCLTLDKKQNGENISETGCNPVFVAGGGLKSSLRNRFFFQLEGTYHYIYENTYVSYFYGGLRAGIMF